MLQKELLMKNLDRFDLYIASVDRKAAFLVTFNSFVLGTLLLKYNDILSLFKNPEIRWAESSILVICLFAIVAAIFCAFNATKPYLKSGNETGDYISLLFFNSVAKMKQEIYWKNICKLKEEDITKDIAIQTHTLALGLEEKFKWINKSKYITMWGTLLCIQLSTFFLVIDYYLRTKG